MTDRLREEQRDANENLMLALLRESERADQAEQESAASHERERELRDMAEFRERLIGIVGHDLRNPLNAVLMASQLLLTGGHLASSDAQLAERVRDSSLRMKRIIVQLIEFTRARLGGGFVLERQRTDLAAVARRIAAELRLTSGRDIRIDQTGDVSGNWDGELLGEVLSNLTGNAIEHGTPDTTIDIALVEAEGVVRAVVTNRGATIPPELRARIFQPFRRAGATRSTNLGLGLYIASEIVRAHAGRILVQSEAGVTSFTVVLPRDAH